MRKNQYIQPKVETMVLCGFNMMQTPGGGSPGSEMDPLSTGAPERVVPPVF